MEGVDFLDSTGLGVLVGGLPAARMGDPTVHGGAIVLGLFTVLIGEVAAGGAPEVDMAALVDVAMGAAAIGAPIARPMVVMPTLP